MNFRRSLLVLASLTVVLVASLFAVSGAQGAVCSPSTPQYCPPPKVKTGPAKHVTSTTATLTGTVNPNGSSTTCFFEYGQTKSYTATTPVQNVGSGTKTVGVTATVTGLTPNTTYHYQLVCKNLGGQAAGGDKTFKTHGAPKKPHTTTERAKQHTSTTAAFRGTVNPNGLATRCRFFYGLTKAYGSTTRLKSVGSGTKTKVFTAVATDLQPKTVYHFRLVCRNAGGRSKGRDRRVQTKSQIRFPGSHTILVSRGGRFVVALHCNGNSHCVGFLTLTGKGGKVLAGPVRYTVPAHKTLRIRMRLTSSGLQQLSQSHHLSGRLRARDKDGSSAHRKVQLRQRQHPQHHGPLQTG